MHSLAIVRETTENHRSKPRTKPHAQNQLSFNCAACKTEINLYTRFDKTVFDLL